VLITALVMGCTARAVWAFPGVWVTKSAEPVKLPTSHVVMMQSHGVTVITTMVDYQGPLQQFALVLPIPDDVDLGRIETVKQEFLARLEEVSAPRLAAFWEKDPCLPGAAEQSWDEKVPVKSRGFLTPKLLPPRDSHYPVSNELSLPSKPVFKRLESEFRYHLLKPKTLATAGEWFKRRGYRIPTTLEASFQGLVARQVKLLVAEVVVEHAEIVGADRLQLGGIRYWTRQPQNRIEAGLGLDGGPQDLFIYMLHPSDRYHAHRLPNVFAPTNLSVRPELGANVGALYNAVFDLLLRKHPRALVTEYVGTTASCGQPCPNAPLKLRELLTLGGDVLETEHASSGVASPPAAVDRDAYRKRFEATLQEMSEGERRLVRRQREAYNKALAERRALLARQTYVLSRLHFRSPAGTPVPDVSLAPASKKLEGGFGVPHGPAATLQTGVTPTKHSGFQVRFFATHPWRGSVKCAKPWRWRWGKRWKSHSQHWRKVHTARNLPRLPRDPRVLSENLLSALPTLGFSPPQARKPGTNVKPQTAATERTSSCAVARAPMAPPAGGLLLLWWFALAFVRRQRFDQ
jgi:hypothetical protein